MSVLTVSGATKVFGTVTALAGASFELREGELLALLGPNGAGKTTLIRAITGRVRLDAGEVRLFGRVLPPAHTPPEIGVVPQEVALYQLLTARENLEAFGRLQGLSGKTLAQHVDWVLDYTGLADRAGEPIKRFSGGMRRRLNIACGIVHRPRVVLLDEPTVGVDPQSRDRIYDLLADLRSTGVSLLLTTHHLEEAEARCSRTIIIDRGKVIAAGTLAELVDRTVGRHRLVTLRVDAPVDVGLAAEGAMEIDAADPRLVQVDVSLRKDAPVKTDTKATLKLKGLTGSVYVELNGGSADAKRLVEATAQGQIPEIASEKSELTNLVESIPKMIETFSSLGGQARKLMTDVGAVTGTMKSAAGDIKDTTSRVKEDPTLLLRRPKKDADK